VRRARLLLAACGLLGCAPEQHPAPPAPPRAIAKFNRLFFAGDVMLSRGVRQRILSAGDPALPFRKIAPMLSNGDLAFVNLESPFSDRGPYHEGGLIFHAPPNTIAGLQSAHIAIASTANNHARDCAAHGVEYTINWLNAHGIANVGSALSGPAAHAGTILVRHDIRFGFLGYTYDQQNGNWQDVDERIALADPAVAARDVRALRQRCDVVIVSMHHGIEYTTKPTAKQVAFAHAMIDAGASLVIGHHPHVIQPREVYRGGLIFYSLGNFVFDQFQRVQTQHGGVAEVDFLGKGILADYLWPVKITPTGPEIE